MVSNKNKDIFNYFSFFLKKIANKYEPINNTNTSVFLIQNTGCAPIKTSLKVPPPTEVTKAIIKTPKGSNFFRIATRDPEIAKEIIPKMYRI